LGGTFMCRSRSFCAQLTKAGAARDKPDHLKAAHDAQGRFKPEIPWRRPLPTPSSQIK